MSSRPTPPSGFVHLILSGYEEEDPFYLELPIPIVISVCLNPRKYLQYLGWCVLGVAGHLVDEEGNEITLNGALLDQGVYRYIVPNDNPLAHAVDLEVIKQRSQVPSETTRTREDFRTKLLARDGPLCVWTGLTGTGMHIIPYSRGDEACWHYSFPSLIAELGILLQWLQLIIANRPHREDLESLSVNDIRNGFIATATLHSSHFDPRDIVVLKVYSQLSLNDHCFNIALESESYSPNHRCPWSSPTRTRGKYQLSEQFPIHVAMDRYPAK